MTSGGVVLRNVSISLFISEGFSARTSKDNDSWILFKEVLSLLKNYFFFLSKAGRIINTCPDIFLHRLQEGIQP